MRSLLTLLLAIPLFVNAQSDSAVSSPFVNEFYGSLNITPKGKTVNLGWGVGVLHTIEPMANTSYSFGIELGTSSQMGTSTLIDDPHKYDLSYTIHYYRIPFFARLNLGERQKAFVEIGGYLEWIDVDAKGTSTLNETTSTVSSKHISQRLQIGPTAAFGYRVFSSKTLDIYAKVAGKLAISPLRNDFQNGQVYNSYINFSVGISLPGSVGKRKGRPAVY